MRLTNLCLTAITLAVLAAGPSPAAHGEREGKLRIALRQVPARSSDAAADDAADVARDFQYDFCHTERELSRPLDQISAAIPLRDDERLPPDCANDLFRAAAGTGPRFGSMTNFHWQATNFFHRPVYFEDVPLERYGQTCHAHLQPAISGAKFFLTLPVLPYKVGVNCPWECVTSMGHVPPGTCAPCVRQTLPVEVDAGLLEATVAWALVFALP
jgi:hypothetical protein